MSRVDDILRDAPGMGWGGTGNYDVAKDQLYQLIKEEIIGPEDDMPENYYNAIVRNNLRAQQLTALNKLFGREA